MVHAELPEPSLRGIRAGSSRLAWAFGISIAIHLLLFGGYQTGKAMHLWENWEWPSWMRPPKMITELFRKQPTPQQLALIEKRQENVPAPLLFVEVSPAQEELEPPKKAEYYSDKNSAAANPDTRRDTTTPKIEGRQTDVVKTEDVAKTRAVPAPPAPAPVPKPVEPPKPDLKPVEPEPEVKPPVKPVEPKPEAKPPPIPAPPKPKPEVAPGPVPTEPKPEPKPLATLMPGDLSRGRPTEATHPVETQAADPTEAAQLPESAQSAQPAKPAKPRTLAEARARQPENQAGLAGEKMRQEGGVRKNRLSSSLDVQATPFGRYDAAIVAAIQNRWYDLLEGRWYAEDRKGRVVLRFHLNSDGSISQMTLVQNTVDLTLALLCESAIRDPSPYRPWPDEMRRLVGADFREVTFTFYYR